MTVYNNNKLVFKCSRNLSVTLAYLSPSPQKVIQDVFLQRKYTDWKFWIVSSAFTFSADPKRKVSKNSDL